MKALICKQYGTPDDLVIDDHPDPAPSDDDVLVRIKAAGINFPDVLTIAGQYQVKTPPPFIPGNEAAGIVEAVGQKVKRFKPGDRVIMTPTGGAFAEKCIASQHLCFPLPEKLGFEQGAGFTITYATSYHALKQSTQISPEDVVLVLGAAGGVGVTAVELAKHMGARVIAAASTDGKLEFARQAGADETINYSTHSLRDSIKQLTDGKGVDVVYDPVGGDIAEQAFRGLGWQGRYLVVGFAAGDIPRFALNIALLKEASIIGVWWGQWASQNPGESLQNMNELAALVENGKLKPRITECFPLDDYAEAFRAITNRKALGKVILQIN